MASLGDSDTDIVDGQGDQNKKQEDNDYEPSSSSKFRFKSKGRPPRENRSRSPGPHRDGRRHHRHHHPSKRRKYSPSTRKENDDCSLYDDTHLPNTSSDQYIDPDTAFRESLFDAMADDEGAQFWEGVYGQPIHTYPNVKEGPQGELERMTDEEYTAYVRAKMYEKTHQHLLEEKARRDAAKKERERLASEGRREQREADKFRKKIEESLRRGEERKTRRVWGEKWDSYLKNWEELGKGGHAKLTIAAMPWPVESGKRRDVSSKEVKRFFLFAPTSGQPSEQEFAKVLKLERVRWHPDKIQQKLGGQDVEEAVIQAVTEVFQIIDQMWSDVREGNKA
jgi:hypothetical protein